MVRLPIFITIMLLSASSAWAVTQRNYQWMYCPAGTKHYGMVVLRDIRYCDGILRGQHLFLNTKTKTKTKR